MPVSAFRAVRPAGISGKPWVRPECRDRLESLGLRTASDFLALPGVVVSGHVGRNVSRVELGGTTAYLKREHRIRVRDRFRSWRDGFGWVSISAREAAVLGRLAESGLPAPKRLAFGEGDGQGFLLLEPAHERTELGLLRMMDDELAQRLGHVIARVHAAGVDQPDLFAKHILVDQDTRTLTILDWQRATLRRAVRWPSRVRGLAALRATLPLDIVGDDAWDRLLTSYFRDAVRAGHRGPDLERLRHLIASASERLMRRWSIRSQRRTTTASVRQELVRIDGETVCAIPDVALALQPAEAIAGLYEPVNDGRLLTLPGGHLGRLTVRRHCLPVGRWWATARGRVWRSRELKAARLLFHLERHGIPAPKLLAYGQTVPRLAPAGSFLLCESLVADCPGPEHEAAVLELLDRLHGAGCRPTGGEPFGVSEGRAVVADPAGVRLVKRLSRRHVARDRVRVAAYLRSSR